MGLRHFTMRGPDVLQAVATKTADFTGDNELAIPSARTAEIWIDTTAVGGGGSLVIIVETSIDGGGVGFTEQIRSSAITTNKTTSLVINRADQSLGKFIRIKGEISVGTIDVGVRVIYME